MVKSIRFTVTSKLSQKSYPLTSKLGRSILYNLLHMTLHRCFVICRLFFPPLYGYQAACEDTELRAEMTVPYSTYTSEEWTFRQLDPKCLSMPLTDYLQVQSGSQKPGRNYTVGISSRLPLASSAVSTDRRIVFVCTRETACRACIRTFV